MRGLTKVSLFLIALIFISPTCASLNDYFTYSGPQMIAKACNDKVCKTPDLESPGFCTEASLYLTCLDEHILNNQDCSTGTQESARARSFFINLMLRIKFCQDFMDVKKILDYCQPPTLSDFDICHKTEMYVNCVQSLTSSPDTQEFEQQFGRILVFLAERLVASRNCSNLEGNVNSTCMYSTCTGLIENDPDDQCSLADAFISCLQENVLDNLSCTWYEQGTAILEVAVVGIYKLTNCG
ncbi:uncharacterized protein LOC131956393 isoform X2 [Physella acuta]|uniref:uncharacterized protein LOC131956393 isoform X2 n=1 Tax=Physella acuta TaxID=109671 RepID=UPI0027DBE783|nr:uncharacterized protein LOC131956393 isoform X2 [Physella acuta]